MKLNKKIDLSFVYFLVICLLTIVVITESLYITGLFPGKGRGEVGQAVPTIGQQVTPAIKGTATMAVVLEKALSAKIVFNSSAAISGVDAILTFDPKLVKIGKLTPNQTLFNQIFANRTQEDKGKIKLTAYLPKKPLIGQQILATFNFELLTGKPAVLGLEFTAPGQPADSNLVSWESQQDILSRVVPLKVEP